MSRVSKIADSPPYAVAEAVDRLGKNIRTARLRRKWSIGELAERVGISRRAMGEIEKGKATSAIVAYLGALWALGLLNQIRSVGDPDLDQEGKALEAARSPSTAPKRQALDDDF
jgi:transcriptional regulator with XRE-family HTH domain